MANKSWQDEKPIAFKLDDYFQLVGWTDRQLRLGRRGATLKVCLDILLRLKLDPEKWLNQVHKEQSHIVIVLGRLNRIKVYIKCCGFKWWRAGGYNKSLFGV